MNSKKKALGRGLSAILESPDTDITSKDISGNYVVGAIASIKIRKIEVNPYQPRKEFNDEHLRELADSIKEQGIIQPLTIRKMGYDRYQLIAGERRLRAAELAGLDEVPCYIRVANDEQMLEMALIENTHRKDLNAVEIALSFQRLIDECQLTQEQLSAKVGKNRATISNYIRLLRLPPEIQVAIIHDKISMGHARALITTEDVSLQLKALQKIILNDLSVRETEILIKSIQTPEKESPEKIPLPEKFINSEKLLQKKLQSGIKIKRNNNGKGSIVIQFDSEKEFDRLIDILT